MRTVKNFMFCLMLTLGIVCIFPTRPIYAADCELDHTVSGIEGLTKENALISSHDIVQTYIKQWGRYNKKDNCYVRFTLNKPGVLIYGSKGSEPGHYYKLDLLDDNNNYIIENQSVNTDNHVWEIGLNQGTYYLNIKYYTDSYLIFTTNIVESDNYEIEPNDVFSSATPIEFHKEYIVDNLPGISFEKDYLSFNVKKGYDYKITVKNKEEANPNIIRYLEDRSTRYSVNLTYDSATDCYTHTFSAANNGINYLYIFSKDAYCMINVEEMHTHSVVIDNGYPATCLEKGITGGSHCSVCGEVIKEQEVIPATGHTAVTDKAVAPTCTKAGKTEGSHCSVCGTVIKEQEVIPATGHTEETDKAVAPTCTKTGKTEGSHCSVCGTVIKEQETIAATGHTAVTDKAVAPTLTKSGKTAGSHCKVCGAVIKPKKTIAKLLNISKVKVTGLTSKYYTGKKISPAVTVTYSGKKLKLNTDYTIGYGTNKSVGKGTVIISGKGKYGGKITKTFSILPRKTAVSAKSTKRGKLNFTVTKRREATKYQIQYATNSKFKSAKTLTTTSLKPVVSASSRKTYYVRVRTVKSVGRTNYYSGWSSVKKIKVK